MNAITDSFKQLVDRKLWPIALVLVAALVAVPFLLGEPEENSLPSPTAAAPSGALDTASVVTLSDADKRDQVRAVLGSRKDPFRPAQLNRVEKPEDALTDAGTQTSVDQPAGGGSTGSTGGTDTTPDPTTVDPTVPEPEAPVKTYDLYSLEVRFGSTENDTLETRNVKRLTGLPGGTNPAVLYLGLSENHKSAVFIVDAGVEVVGDGKCDPGPDDCQTLVLKPGETVFLTRGEKQWELDLIKIYTNKTTDKDEAISSRKAVASGGRAKLRRLRDRVGRYRYSERDGTLYRVAPEPGLEPEPESAPEAASSTFTSTG